MKKRIVSLLLCAAMLLSLAPMALAEETPENAEALQSLPLTGEVGSDTAEAGGVDQESSSLFAHSSSLNEDAPQSLPLAEEALKPAETEELLLGAMGDYGGNETGATWYWPIHGYSSTSSAYAKITSSYGFRGGSYQSTHKGVDIGESNGTKVYAVRSGTVSTVHNSITDTCGRYVIINHGDGYFSIYMHLSSISVSSGQSVSYTTQIGTVGGSGANTDGSSPSETYYGYHLHLGIHYGSSFSFTCNVNPCPSGYTRIGNSMQENVGGYAIGSATISYAIVQSGGGVITPVLTPTGAWISVSDKNPSTTDNVTLTWGANNATSYDMQVYKNGSSCFSSTNTSYTGTFSAGNYTAYMTASNASGSAASVSVSFTVVQATSGTCGTNVNWSFNSISGKLTIYGSGAMTSRPWGFGEASELSKKIKTVEINSGVTSVVEAAFIECTALTSVILADSVTSIGKGAFSGCTSLWSVKLSNNLKEIPESAFSGCSSLTNITIPNSVTTIGNAAFAQSGLVSIILPVGLKTIVSRAFNYCSNLESVTIPSSVTSIEAYAFGGCSKLSYVTIPSGITTIKDGTFSGCESLRRVEIPASVTKIGSGAFVNCNYLVAIYYGGSQAQWNAISVGSRNDPLTYASMHYEAFGVCGPNLTWIYNDIGGVLIISGTGAMANYGVVTPPWSNYDLCEVRISSGVTNIGNGAFRDCSSLRRITIPDSVTGIGWRAFSGCSSLTSITIPDSVTSISEHAFYNCSSLTSITIPNSVTSIEDYAFSGSRLESITIPDSVTSIRENAFYNCSSLTSINVAEYNTAYASKDGLLFNKNKTELLLCPGGKTSVSIPNGVTSIGYGAFECCTALTSITIPDSVTSIGSYAFSNCSSLTSVYISDLASWCSIVFHDYPSNPLNYAHNLYLNGELLTEAVIPDNVTSIGAWAFWRCSLTSITLPDSVTSIGDSAFYDCSSLTDVYYGGTEAEWNAVTVKGSNAPLTSATIHFMKCNHTYTAAVTTEATCTEPGVKTYTCSACGDSYTETITALGHSLKHWDAHAATCTEAGWTEGDSCIRCDYVSGLVEIPALGHNWSAEKQILKEATATETGVKAYVCTRCDATKDEEVIPVFVTDPDATLTITGGKARAGQTVTVALQLSENPGIAGMRLNVSYDSALTLEKAETGDTLTTLAFTKPGNLSANPVALFWDGMDDDTTCGETGTILILTFRVAEGTDAGEYPVTVTYASDEVYNAAFEDVTLAVQNGTVTVIDYVAGDANGDMLVNGKDVTVLRQYLAGGYNVTIDELAADANHDGKANGKDVTMLRQYLAGGYGIVLD